MGATKATLIVVGTVTGLGAVLAYQPPHQTLNLGGSGGGLMGKGSTPSPSATPTQSGAAATPTPTPSQAATTPTTVKTPAPQKTTAKPVVPKKPKPPVAKSVNGTFSGAAQSTPWGPLQVEIVVKNSKIVSARPIQLPTSGGAFEVDLNNQVIPILISETLAAQSADIQGLSQASFTSQAWYDSLVSALAKAKI